MIREEGSLVKGFYRYSIAVLSAIIIMGSQPKFDYPMMQDATPCTVFNLEWQVASNNSNNSAQAGPATE